MTTVELDIHARLTAVLGPDIPVLLPEQLREPLQAAPLDAQGRPVVGGGERGIGAYLKQHPQGYVQIEQGTPIMVGASGIQSTFWWPISCTASSSQDCGELHGQVHLILCGIPGREPGYYLEKIPGMSRLLAPGVWQARFTVTRPVINGRI